MNEPEKFRKRLSELRLKKGVSEYSMSLNLDQSKGYIQQISSGRTLPSMNVFFHICEYFEISPSEFFDYDNRDPALVREVLAMARKMSDDDLKEILSIMDKFVRAAQCPPELDTP